MIVENVQFDRAGTYDIAVAICGYETRSSYICRLGVDAQIKIASTYEQTASTAFHGNRTLFEAAGWTIVQERELVAQLQAAIHQTRNPRVLVDISSMARRTIARVVQSLWLNPAIGEVTFTYAPARFESSAEAANIVPSLSAGPLADYFAGALRSPSIPVGLILGLGLEPHRALGLVELIEPSKVWAFSAISDDDRFTNGVQDVHGGLLSPGSNVMSLYYDIRSIADLYSALESLTFSAAISHRLLIAPSGPKIFTLTALLVGLPRDPFRPAIWRVGSILPSGAEMDVVEAGDVVAARVELAGVQADAM